MYRWEYVPKASFLCKCFPNCDHLPPPQGPSIKEVGNSEWGGSKMDQNLPTDSYKNMPKRERDVKKNKMSTSFMDGPKAYAQGYSRKLLTSDITRTLRLVGGKVFFCWPTYFSKEDLALLMRNA
jgi:hypothetical protein